MKHLIASFSRALNQRQHYKYVYVVSFIALVGSLIAGPAQADDFADATKLVRAGQFAQALTKVDTFLAQHPKDAQMRFLKGLILTEQNKSTEAIAVFIKLTDDFPDLPEPYNNLAVLFASSGQYDKARASLDMAIRTNPTYATAHENLGDVYAKLASQAYDKALQLDSGNAGAKSKLTLIRTLTGNASGGNNPKVASAAMPDARPAQKPATESAPSKAAPAPVPPPAPPAVIAKAEPKPEIKPASPAPRQNDADQEAIIKLLNNWAKAWSAKDVKNYLAFYAGDFATPKGESRKEWAEARRSRIEGKGRINVDISAPQISIDDNKATVKFRQTYTSDRLSANSRKTLILEKSGGKWLIKQERAGS